ncbi:hypothetical protein LOK49_LG05G01744 [Camellia lanceoleosa]|uniref:Uncharacterized protein n=1 Tax=Camellia lanceoleosa TaxID=1840588 RepID=A0ACC0HMS3_9ERIC|nr:hypothetical protein LOK49_LG05G01744 [Camellia lanceoleosa]
MSAFLRVTDAIEDTNLELQTCVHQVRDLTYHTNNIFDQFTMDSSMNLSRKFIIKLRAANTVEQGSSSNVANNGGCYDRRGDALLLEESELVGIQKPKK